jgi:hypothetical protein
VLEVLQPSRGGVLSLLERSFPDKVYIRGNSSRAVSLAQVGTGWH